MADFEHGDSPIASTMMRGSPKSFVDIDVGVHSAIDPLNNMRFSHY